MRYNRYVSVLKSKDATRVLIILALLSGLTSTLSFFLHSSPKHKQSYHQATWRGYNLDRSLLTSASPRTITKQLIVRRMNAQSMKEPAVVSASKETTKSRRVTTRTLGSQELLMLPRQYKPKETGIMFPPMIHMCAVTLNRTPSIPHLLSAVQNAIDAHPLLSCRVEGDGEPNARVDGLQMVRSGNPNPETFVVVDSFQPMDVVKVVTIPDEWNITSLENSWSKSFQDNIDRGHFNTSCGPLWSLELHKFDNGDDSVAVDRPCALVFSLNHAISDQSSVNMLIDQIIADIASLEATTSPDEEGHYVPAIQNSLPNSVEECTLGKGQSFDDAGVSRSLVSPDSFMYLLEKASEGFKNAPIMPDNTNYGDLDSIDVGSSGKRSSSYFRRESMVEYRKLSKEDTSQLLKKCREKGVTLSNALTAAMAYTSSDFIGGKNSDIGISSLKSKVRTYKVLQSLDMRRFGVQPDPCETIGCQAGSHDLMLGPISDFSGKMLRQNAQDPVIKEKFWDVARLGRDQTKKFIDSNGPINAVRIFDFAMSISDMNNLVHWTAQSKSSQGRAYSAGVTNAGVFEKQKAVRREGADDQRKALQTTHGKYSIEDIFFASSHAWSGSLYHVSLLTVNGELKLTFHPVSPIVSRKNSKHFADAYIELLKSIAVENDGMKTVVDEEKRFSQDTILGLLAAGAIFCGVAIHWDAWTHFISSLIAMRENTPDVKDFWDALNFWIFFAVAHPILQPLLWISDVLHGSPGPMVADLVPLTFLIGNLVFIGATLVSKSIRYIINIAALSAFLMYVGAGLDGQGGLGDYNLQLDDSYKGEIVKGCPAYADIRQPSMEGFDLEKYQGRWYEQKFHDWTQFKEVYDTTLDIKLTPDGAGWIDDFGVKGPAPQAARLSWDKSPVANGAHYFLFGRVDANDPPGVLREKGFNVEFPNYIVDVQKDPVTGDYTEAIQFQCLERGGVRVFEGINFLSRSPEMTEKQLQAMHERAAAAGMNAYGASIDQMHHVERRQVDSPDIENSWQALWRAIGVDKLLEFLTESIEDGGRDSN